MDIITKEEAQALGLKRFFTGMPCKHGHVCERKLNKFQTCVECARQACKADYLKRKDIIRKQHADWRAANIERTKELSKKWLEKNKDRHRENGSNWYRNNKARVCAKARAREERIKRCTPLWADSMQIELIYKQCHDITNITGVKHHVDHIIPLQGERVCGLHVHYNLQVITAKENLSKSNNFEID